MFDNFSVVIRLYRKETGIIQEEFFRVYGIDKVKTLHKELAKIQRLFGNEKGMRMPSYSDTSSLCHSYGRKIDKEEFKNLSPSGELIQTWNDLSDDYEFEEHKIVKNE